MFGEMTSALQETTVRMLFHVQIEQKVEREQVAQVTGTNKDDQRLSHLRSGKRKRFIQMIHAPAEAARNTNSAAEENSNQVSA